MMGLITESILANKECVMKRPNGTGGVRKLSGRRRKPYQAVVTSGQVIRNGKIVPKQISAGTYKTKREALNALSDYTRGVLNADGRKITFGDVYETIRHDMTLSVQKSMRTAYTHCQTIKNKRMVDLKIEHYQIIFDSIDNMSNATKSELKLLFSKVNRYCLERDYILKDYSQFVKVNRSKEKKLVSIYTPDEIRIVEKCADPVQRILLYTGMRISELINMKTSDVRTHRTRPYFCVTTSKTSSGIRSIPIHKNILKTVKLDGEYILEPHRAYSAHLADLQAFNKRHNLNHTFHDFRKTFATGLKNCKVDDFYRRALLGHAQGNLTDAIYTKATMDELIKSVDELHYL